MTNTQISHPPYPQLVDGFHFFLPWLIDKIHIILLRPINVFCEEINGKGAQKRTVSTNGSIMLFEKSRKVVKKRLLVDVLCQISLDSTLCKINSSGESINFLYITDFR